MLDPFGIDKLTQDVYLAILNTPGAGVQKLTELLRCTEQEVRTALDRLAEIGLASTFESKEAGWQAIDPEVGLPALLAKQQAEIALQQARLEQGRLGVAMLLSRHDELAPSTGTSEVRRLIGIDAIRAKLRELSNECESEVWSLNPGGGHSRDALQSSKQLTARSLSQGIEVRSVYSDSVRNDAATVEHLRSLTELGALVRTHQAVPVRMILVDRSRAIVPSNADHTSASALYITGSGLIGALAALYLTIWEQSQPLTKSRPRRVADLNEQEHYALRLWAKGYTDSVVGRTLGISERTVRRISETVAGKFRSNSRFQTGAKAVFEGWVTEDDTILAARGLVDHRY